MADARSTIARAPLRVERVVVDRARRRRCRSAPPATPVPHTSGATCTDRSSTSTASPPRRLVADYEAALGEAPRRAGVRPRPLPRGGAGWRHGPGHDLDALQRAASRPGRRRRTTSSTRTATSCSGRLNFAVRAATWERLGGFDTGYRGYGAEDTDLGLRARRLGIPAAVGRRRRACTTSGTRRPASIPTARAEIVANARRFHERWGTWPMTGWLDELAAAGAVRFDPARRRARGGGDDDRHHERGRRTRRSTVSCATPSRSPARPAPASPATTTSPRAAPTRRPAPPSYHWHFTDRLFGATVEDAAGAFVDASTAAIGGRHVVTLHDVPPADGDDRDRRRAAAYRRVAARLPRRRRGERARAPAAAPRPASCADVDVIPLPVVPLAPAHACRAADDRIGRTVGILGFIYPGKGHADVHRRGGRAARRRRRRRPRPAERRARRPRRDAARDPPASRRPASSTSPGSSTTPTWPPPSTPSTSRSCRPATCRPRPRSARGSPPGADRSSSPTTTPASWPRSRPASSRCTSRRAVGARHRRALARPRVDAPHASPSPPASASTPSPPPTVALYRRVAAVSAADVRIRSSTPAGSGCRTTGGTWSPSASTAAPSLASRSSCRTSSSRTRCGGCTPRSPTSTRPASSSSSPTTARRVPGAAAADAATHCAPRSVRQDDRGCRPGAARNLAAARRRRRRARVPRRRHRARRRHRRPARRVAEPRCPTRWSSAGAATST